MGLERHSQRNSESRSSCTVHAVSNGSTTHRNGRPIHWRSHQDQRSRRKVPLHGRRRALQRRARVLGKRRARRKILPSPQEQAGVRQLRGSRASTPLKRSHRPCGAHSQERTRRGIRVPGNHNSRGVPRASRCQPAGPIPLRKRHRERVGHRRGHTLRGRQHVLHCTPTQGDQKKREHSSREDLCWTNHGSLCSTRTVPTSERHRGRSSKDGIHRRNRR
uniref:25-kDa nonstructural protein n=1 Tax=Infectious pancreatic necrosis virus TaxID=11002 RepID=Q69CH6_9VIRU|nr:25-kDa nonstructural protein [Infectious pancreatic necrosis virus]